MYREIGLQMMFVSKMAAPVVMHVLIRQIEIRKITIQSSIGDTFEQLFLKASELGDVPTFLDQIISIKINKNAKNYELFRFLFPCLNVCFFERRY